ncbi:hypothetical protein WDU94_002648 [Cyamophila willieti]
MGPKPKAPPPPKDVLTDPLFSPTIDDITVHTKSIKDRIKMAHQNVLNFKALLKNNPKDFKIDEKINLCTNIQGDLRDKLKDLEDTTKKVRDTLGMLDPTNVYANVELNKLDVEINSIKPLL